MSGTTGSATDTALLGEMQAAGEASIQFQAQSSILQDKLDAEKSAVGVKD